MLNSLVDYIVVFYYYLHDIFRFEYRSFTSHHDKSSSKLDLCCLPTLHLLFQVRFKIVWQWARWGQFMFRFFWFYFVLIWISKLWDLGQVMMATYPPSPLKLFLIFLGDNVMLFPLEMTSLLTNSELQSIYTCKTWILSVCLSVRVFRRHQKSQGHEILALGLLWANLNSKSPIFEILIFKGGSPYGPVLKICWISDKYSSAFSKATKSPRLMRFLLLA